MKLKKIFRNLVIYSVMAAVAAGILIGIWFSATVEFDPISDLPLQLLVGLMVGGMLLYPLILTLINVIMLFYKTQDQDILKQGRYIEYITMALGIFYNYLAMDFFNIRYTDWHEALYRGEIHTPMWLEARLTVIVIFSVGLAGYVVLSRIRVNRVPPLISVGAIAAMYLGTLICMVWIVQTAARSSFYLILFPANFIIIAAKNIRLKVLEWEMEEHTEIRGFRHPCLNWLNNFLRNSRYWPAAAFILMWPMLGLVIVILLLFGQEPDSIIKVWTETSDWNLSQRVAPEDLRRNNGHYLCTVAAGGHETIVRPVRMGERHGNRIVVNRQLCIANAFEQILEERLPAIHGPVRRFYDRYGFPLSKLIRTKLAADCIYIVMKPLEWFFLTVIYLCDVKPENRIAVQYLPRQQGVLHEKNDKWVGDL